MRSVRVTTAAVEKARSIEHYDHVSVFLPELPVIVTCGLPVCLYQTVPHYLTNATILEKMY